jgi:hypothetical protein
LITVHLKMQNLELVVVLVETRQDGQTYQMGIVLLNASGIRFPLLVESTITNPPSFMANSTNPRLALRMENDQAFVCPSVDLK